MAYKTLFCLEFHFIEQHSKNSNYVLADELGDFAPELKISFFQLGISPQIVASIIMQVGTFNFHSSYLICEIWQYTFYVVKV